MRKSSFFADHPVENIRKGDIFLIISVILLWGLGIFTLFICSTQFAEIHFDSKYYFVMRQLLWSIPGFAVMIFVSLVPMKFIHKVLPLFVFATLLLCFMTLIPGLGKNVNGSTRWLFIGGFSFQPSEAAKFAVVLFLANYFAKEFHHNELSGETARNFIRPLIGLFIFIIAIFIEKDLSTGIFIFIVGVLMFFVTGAKLSWMIPLTLLGIPSIIMLIFSEQYRIMRVMAFFKPEEYTLTYAYQQFAAKRAIIQGGFWGCGLGSGLDKVFSIPEVQADYVFAGWASAMGLLGVAAYFIILVFFAYRSFKIAFTTENVFASYGAFGCACTIVLQSLVNCAVVCGAMPTTGIPLPFFSSGGTSLLFTMAMCGFIINCSHCEASDDYYLESYQKVYTEKESFNGVVVDYE